MANRFTLSAHLDALEQGRLNDEVMIARDLQASGLTRSEALKAAADHVARMYRQGREPGGIVSVERQPGDNGGPILNDD